MIIRIFALNLNKSLGWTNLFFLIQALKAYPTPHQKFLKIFQAI